MTEATSKDTVDNTVGPGGGDPIEEAIRTLGLREAAERRRVRHPDRRVSVVCKYLRRHETNANTEGV